jgi:hypothetical protein
MAFVKGKFRPQPEYGNLVIGDNLIDVGIVEVIEEDVGGIWIVECSDGEVRHVIAKWTAKDEEEGTVEENFWWQDCASAAVPWFE